MANCLLHCFSSVQGGRERDIEQARESESEREGLGLVIVWGEMSERGRVSLLLRLSGSSCCLLMIKSFPSFLTHKHICTPNTCSSRELGMESTLHKLEENKRGRVCLSCRPGHGWLFVLRADGRPVGSYCKLLCSLIPSCPSLSLTLSLTHSLWYMTSVYVKLDFSESRVTAGHMSPVFYTGFCKTQNLTTDSLSTDEF